MDNFNIKYYVDILNQNGTALIAICTALYLYVTWKIFNENRKTYLAQYMPIVYIDYSRKDKEFKITNIGNGLAINIEISSLRIFTTDIEAEFRLDFEKVYNLTPHETKSLLFKEKVNGKILHEGPLGAHLYSQFSDNNYIFTVILKDILGNIYYQKVNMGKSGIYIIKHFKTWWLTRWLFLIKDRIDDFMFFATRGIKNKLMLSSSKKRSSHRKREL